MSALLVALALLVAGILLAVLGVVELRAHAPHSLRPFLYGAGDILIGSAVLLAALHHLELILSE